ncbi:Arc family DNA-binding protein [Sinorhizobium meliloti]|uniref:Arc family DNA-binding protein n=1 Tax=Rhizobium meliloti TaxID=382 RepID=UPI000FDC9735|nr:Arc family DNA-binding protein [Sinorhizobium meliloti]MQX63624.1 Arc family DNA-binding protein [Sinorhizobium meliloti]MQX63729.1 Arc family DNA-binding protein [Sinorhizobium meliloti]RVE81310.1 Arc family DNA-binding protein [Sinorhizobium meliloti]RVG45313.1 Arc family DNA-binding protein [Sinorhizobium meliloti]
MAAERPGRGSDQFPLRLPDGMRDRIKRHAEANGRSMNSEIVSLIEAALWEADMARMQAGLEPLREPSERDWVVINHAREIEARRKDAAKDPMNFQEVPFFDEPAAMLPHLKSNLEHLPSDLLTALDLIVTHFAQHHKSKT